MKTKSNRIKHIADLSNIPLSRMQETDLEKAFQETIEVINNLNELDTDRVEPMHQVNNLENIFRKDEVDAKRSFTQAQALQNTTQTFEGYFVADAVLDKNQE